MNPEQPVLNLGVVGFGKLGLLHGALAQGLPNCRLAGVADHSSTMLSMLKSQMDGVQIETSHTALLKSTKLDGVFIAAPTNFHIPIAVDFVEAGIPIFIEKPLSLTAEQAKPLLRALEKKPVVNMVGYMSRFIDTFQLSREVIQSGALGKIQRISATMYISQLLKPGKGWRYKKATSGGGVLITQNSHLIDMLSWLFGNIQWVSGHTSKLYSEEVEDAAHVYLGFENGQTAWIDTSWSARHHRTLTMNIKVQGENGTLEVTDDDVSLFLDVQTTKFQAGWTTWKKPDLFRGVSIDVGGPQYTRQAEQFVNAIRGNGEIDSDVISSVRLQAVLDAIYSSAENRGQPTDIAKFLSR